MPQFLYVILPSEQRACATPDEARALAAAAPRGLTCAGVPVESPWGRGILAMPATTEPAPGRFCLDPDRQTWRERQPINTNGIEERVFAGVWNDWRPGPSDLARERQRTGKTIRLGDENLWNMPTLRFATGGWNLEQSICVEPDGTIGLEVLPKYRELCIRAEAHIDAITAGFAPENFLDMLSLLTDSLALNYCLGPAECNLLGLWTTDNVMEAGRILIDFDGMLAMSEAVKKN